MLAIEKNYGPQAQATMNDEFVVESDKETAADEIALAKDANKDEQNVAAIDNDPDSNDEFDDIDEIITILPDSKDNDEQKTDDNVLEETLEMSNSIAL